MGREKPLPKAHRAARPKRQQGRPRKGEERPREPTRLERQLTMTLPEMLDELPKACDVGVKKNAKGVLEKWVGYKLYIDAADGGVPVSCILTSASMHDSQAAIALACLTAGRVDNLYDLMDAACDAEEIRAHSRTLGHTAIIDITPRRSVELKEAMKREAKARRAIGYVCFPKRGATASARLSNGSMRASEFGARHVRVRGDAKVLSYQEYTVSGVRFAGNTLSSPSPHSITLNVATGTPTGTTVTLGLVDQDGVPRSGGLQITVGTASTNTAPTAADNTVTTAQDTAYIFTAADFRFADTDTGDTLASVRIATRPGVGTLALDGAAVTMNQVIPKADIDASKLVFTPVSGGSGTAYTAFTFKVNDGTVDSADAYTMTIDVTIVLPVVSVAAVHPKAAPGLADAEFRLTVSPAPASALAVTLSIDQAAEYLSDTEPTVAIEAGETSVTATHPISTAASLAPGDLTATVTGGGGAYRPAAAPVAVVFTSPPLTAAWAADAYTADEGVPKPPRSYLIRVITGSDSATVGGDYTHVTSELTVEPGDWTADGAVFTATVALTVETVEDSVLEGDERFYVILIKAAGQVPPGLECPDELGGVTGCATVVTIADDETPSVTEVTVNSTPAVGETYLAGKAIELTVGFTASVTVTGTPTFAFTLGSAVRQSVYASGSETSALVFSPTPCWRATWTGTASRGRRMRLRLPAGPSG